MINADQKAFFERIQACFSLWEMNPTDTAQAMWFSLLSDFSLDEVIRGLNDFLRSTDQFKPKHPQPSDIIKMIEGSAQDKSIFAWTKVIKAIKHVGAYQSVVFDDPIVHAVISDLGGWAAMCRVIDKELPFKAKEFQVRYNAYKGKVDKYPAKLIGIADHSNSVDGFKEGAPILIGNETKALQVLESGSSSPAIGFKRLELPKQLEREND